MLGVLKRRWKPKRSSPGSKISAADTNSLDSYDREKSTRNHQVHPVLDSQTFLSYDIPTLIERSTTPPPISTTQQTTPPQCYPLAPNICVEAGRIQFIRPETEGCKNENVIAGVATAGRVTVTRGLQTDQEEEPDSFKDIQSSLEKRILELETSLENAQKSELRDKQLITKLQKSLNRRESAHRDADRERRLRADSETRAKQALQEAARCRSRLKLLTNEFARMEDTVRSMLAYKKQAEQLRQEKAALTLAFESRCKQYQSTISHLNLEISRLRQQIDQVGEDQHPEDFLQAQTAALHRHAEDSRKQYEKCLDDVANQVVKALLAQKGLKEEVGTLNNKIQELETQNRALTLMLVHQLRGDSPSSSLDFEAYSRNLDDEKLKSKKEPSVKASPTSLMRTSLNMKHCNSFNSEILDESPRTDAFVLSLTDGLEKRLSADSTTALDTRLSLEDKKRHQVLTKLWTELKGTEVTPKRLIEALSAVDSALFVPPKRPVSLNLQLPIFQASKYRGRPLLTQTSSKSEEEATGNESPESGNRDEGYSTMSSDVQADVTRGSGDATLPRRDLEDLKEASDETDLSDTRLLVTDSKDPDILYIPLNLINLKQRNSFPPGKDILPFQHIMRSFSDSHLCIKITTAPSPCYTFSSPISSSPSFFLFDLTETAINPLIRNCGGHPVFNNASDDKTSQLSWSSATDDRLECTTWDAEYIQHWLKLDETRSTLQQQHRDMLELEYDRAELEDWSLSLSNDDLREQWKKDATTPSQISISTLPSIQENNQLELEEDSNECLWNNSSYMIDKEGRELVTLLMDGVNSEKHQQWPYAVQQQISPDNSWSSAGSDCYSHGVEIDSKRSSAALSGSSDDTGEIPAIGTDFTRDFYRLVKFESTKSLASISSRSLGLSENGDRDSNLQNVLTFIAEQQKYVAACEENGRPFSMNDITKEFNIEGPPLHQCDIKISDSENSLNSKRDVTNSDSENYVTLRQLCEEFSLQEKKIEYAEEICLVTPIDVESENCSNISERPVDICSSVNVEITSIENEEKNVSAKVEPDHMESPNDLQEVKSESVDEGLKRNLDDSISDINDSMTDSMNTSTSLTSSVSTPDTIVSKIPLRKTPSKSRISVPSPNKTPTNNNNYSAETKIPKSKIAYKSNSKPKLKKIVHVHQNNPAQHVITSERLPQSSSGVISNIIEGPPHRAVSFHERATSKDVIDELNRMIKNGDETVIEKEQNENAAALNNERLDQACKPTGWVHVEKGVDLSDPKARANLLDVMMASVSSDSSPTSSCGGSITSDSTEDPPDYNHLHKIHKYHRQKKANAVRPEMAVVRASLPTMRPSIIGRPDFYVRYGDKEKEAVASFDFLDEFGSMNATVEEELNPLDENVCSAQRRMYKVSQV